MKRGQETLMPNWALEAYESLTLASDIKLLNYLARHRGYRGNTYSTKQLAIALEIDLRTTQSGTARLAQLGYILSAEGQHCSVDAQTRMPQAYCKALASLMQASNKSTRAAPPLEQRQDEENDALNLKNFRTDELMKKEEQTGAQESTALVEAPPSPESGFETNTPAVASETNVPSLETVPRRRAAPAEMPEMPASLAVLPGMPEAWGEWMTYRRERKLATAPSTAKGMFVNLQKYHAEGLNPVEVIRNSIDQGYQGLFPAKGHIVKFQPRPRTTEEANEKFVAGFQENVNAVKGVF